MPGTTTDWSLSLTDSVVALGAAARELRAAHANARHTAWTTDPARLVPVPGLLHLADARPVGPHNEAVWQISNLHLVLEHHTMELYENGALGYAYGTSQAIEAVLRSEHPSHVELRRDRNGKYLPLPDGLPDLTDSLGSQAGDRQLTALRDRFTECERAAHDAEVVGRAPEFSADLADAAYAYGECAEKALRYLLRFAEEHGFLRAG